LKTITEKDFKNVKALAKELLVGRESALVGRLSKSENHLGRSLIVGVGSDKPTFSQVDHRTLRWLIIKNIKYSVK
jgi:hypothetical protein